MYAVFVNHVDLHEGEIAVRSQDTVSETESTGIMGGRDFRGVARKRKSDIAMAITGCRVVSKG